jgi:RNA polymerase sigma factor (sigma-70 family)
MVIAGDMAAAGGEERLEQLYDRFSARLFRFALRVSRDDGEARDYVHDAYMRAARDLRRVPQADGEAMAWLIRVVVNLARDRYRRTLVRDAFARLAMRHETHDPRPALDAGEAVRGAMASLSPRQRAVVALHHLDGEPVADIAVTLDLSPATVRWHLADARRRLAVLLKGIS